MHSELDLAIGSAAIFLIGFAMIFILGSIAESMWHSKLGADLGGSICAVGIVGILLHYARSRVLNARILLLGRGERVNAQLSETFWTSSSDRDLILQTAIGAVVLLLTYLS